ncbi:histone-lysine N-methyltransferase SETMAR [Trichonephila clavipes]|nr:histone-lysine N-methyltransferase SETMAR [Trichonephila clavipes]
MPMRREQLSNWKQKSASETFDMIREAVSMASIFRSHKAFKEGSQNVEDIEQWKERLEQEGDNFLKLLIRADEAWLYQYDPTIKQSNEWKRPSSPTPKKAKTVESAGKVVTITFFDYEGIVYQHAVEPGTIVNGSYYANVLRTMVQHVKKKLQLFLLHHENARPHVARYILDVLQQKNVEIFPYSPDLTPCDFWLFPQLKKSLRSKRFASNKVCVKCVEAVLKRLTKRTSVLML